MSISEEVAREQMDSNDPEVKPGQIWTFTEDKKTWGYPDNIRIICPYTFAEPEDGRLWVVEDSSTITVLMRCPELTLRMCYELSENGE